MKKMILSFLLLVSSSTFLNGQRLYPLSPQQASLGGTSLGRVNAASVIYANPALLKFVEGTSVMINYRRLYNLAELDQVALAASHDFGSLCVGVGFSSFGKPDFWLENALALGVSGNLGRHFSVGARGDYRRVSFDGSIEAQDEFSFAVGAAAIYDKVVFHAAFSELNRPRFSDQDQKSEPGYRIGASFQNLSNMVVNLEITGKKNGFRRYHFGQEVNLEKNFFIRFGVVTNPTLPTGGFGVRFGIFGLDYAINHHTDLGETHSVGFLVKL